MARKHIHLIAAARPNFMKVAPLYHALTTCSDWGEPILVHTGQHYDINMSDHFFRDLRLPAPHYNLDVGSGSHAEQTAGVMVAYERLCMEQRPDAVIVVGDVNSTLACSIVAKKLCLPLAHLEAGLRSRDMTMPEEINRIMTDSIADVLWTPSADADANLLAEGKRPEQVVRVGNIMIDSYEMLRDVINAADEVERMGMMPKSYGMVTLHRPVNVDSEIALAALVKNLRMIAQKLELIFPVHPRTRKKLADFDLLKPLEQINSIRIIEPLSYIHFMSLVQAAACVITDSGGVQEETTYLGIPCITLRETTERPITVTEGTNRLVKIDDLDGAIDLVVSGHWPKGRRPDHWDGKTANRVVSSLTSWLN